MLLITANLAFPQYGARSLCPCHSSKKTWGLV